jgi:hypothetical protein
MSDSPELEETDQVWFITDYDSVWAVTGLVNDVESAVQRYPTYVFFYGPRYTATNWAAIQSDRRRPGMLFPPTYMADAEQSGSGVVTDSEGPVVGQWLSGPVDSQA